MKILVSDKLEDEGLRILRAEPGVEVDVKTDLAPDQLKAVIGQYDGICIRSATKLSADVLANPGKLRAIARAGVGVDNVDLPTATRRGIVVMNAPDGNTISTAELTVGLMIAASRHMAPACAGLKAGRWDRKSFMGRQLAEKTVGIVGLGRVGLAVAKRALAFGTKIIGYDPFVAGAPPDLARQIRLVDSLDDLLKEADYLTVHTPLDDQTRGLIGKKELERLPKGAFVINAARGGIIDEAALLDALNAGHLAGAALDVYTAEPPECRALLEHPKVLCLPHLGASTHEAQYNVAIDACRNLVDYLAGRELRGAVNVPAIDFATLGALRPYVELGHRMGVLLATLMRGRLKRLEVTLAGDITDAPYSPITTGVVIGLLERIVPGPVNMVNALVVARENGLDVSERTDPDARGYASSVRVTVEGDRESHAVHGTVFHRNYPRVTLLDGFEIELAPEGDLVVTFHEDRPGVIGEVGTTLGRHRINIASMACGRKVETQEACLGLTLDSVPSAAVLDELRGKTFMKHVHYISLPPLVSQSA